MQNLKCSIIVTFFLGSISLHGQGDSTDYYYEVPEYPEVYNAGTVAARVVDGLGFRYYWGTEGLTESDLSYRPSEGARNVEETIDHICLLAAIIESSAKAETFEGVNLEGLSYEEKREMTLESIRNASVILKASDDDQLNGYNISFANGTEFPFWNLLNGPIADAVNHVGQIISFRRTNGNPYNQSLSVLQGKVRN